MGFLFQAVADTARGKMFQINSPRVEAQHEKRAETFIESGTQNQNSQTCCQAGSFGGSGGCSTIEATRGRSADCRGFRVQANLIKPNPLKCQGNPAQNFEYSVGADGAIWLPHKQGPCIPARKVAGYKIIGTPHPACRMGWSGEKAFTKGGVAASVIGEPLPGKVGRTKRTPLTRQTHSTQGK